MPCPAIFLDRDGVINENRSDYVKSWAEFVFLPGALEALRKLADLDRPVIVISNQSAIGRGIVDRETIDEINARMMDAVRAAGGRIDGVLYCPHRPDEGCICRKPRPGLLLLAAGRFGLDLCASYLIGDAESDILAAHAAGCRAILVKSGRGAEQLQLLQQHGINGFHVADDLSHAVAWLLRKEQHG
ncbi:MAG: D-glycero-beta-D-manno-heptose 1,7-bisphosphate 7-phosphatase [Anaerolineae bacterium]